MVFHGADINGTNAQGKTALDLAIKNNNEVVKKALENLMDNNSKQKEPIQKIQHLSHY